MSDDLFLSSPGTEQLIDRLRRATIGRYDIYAELGTGGMASVYLALDLALDRKVAIKVMSPALASSPENIERFKREAKVSASLNHPNIIGILAVGEDPDLAFFVMKYVEGRSLDSVIREGGKQSIPFVQTIIGSAGRALHHAHLRGIVHRDVKPANFMLDLDGWLIVTDFGIAKLDDSKGLTMTGTMIGTPYYMSPEQFNGKAVTGATDQYALGVVAYELLTGLTPYRGDTVMEVMRGHLFDDMPPLRDHRPDIPAELEACIARMIAKDPAQRFPTLEDAVRAFGAVTPDQEADVRTQIISLAKSGAMAQPRMSVPLSPVPQSRPSKKAAAATEARPPRGRPAAKTALAEPAPRSRAGLKVFGTLVVLAAAAAGTAVARPDLVDRLTGKYLADSLARADSVLRAQQLAMAARDSAARADSVQAAILADSLAVLGGLADSLERERQRVALAERQRIARARADSIARAEAAAAQAAAATAAPTAASGNTPGNTPAQVQEPPVAVPTGPGYLKIGSRNTVLYFGNEIRPMTGLTTLEVPSGTLTLSIRRENCASWDSTVTITPAETTSVGNRFPRC